ncbi:efflux RND transporter periplasmic adaptor subunit [Chelativorans sp. M5D2P16]|uniref:efflux RND transporter periplasmic adaptor subunit n=1 Tax=Chelativorans sp. M5D2P16 TaxID=3095678 RepID=UPI002ACA4B21|nr:efflux RND transporter periplasmic adaptor subunit [Chelativorans sp. M5D2P16]MDZ5699201.1 efflux RND transporter periplasmic adaptor subunit [Chelativorans sp. M5D2P16]
MPKVKFHKIAAVAVLIATAAWIATGEFSSVGSATQEAEAARAEAEPERPAEVKTVQATMPSRLEHARTIRISGQTEADKRAVLAARTAGIVDEFPVSEGEAVEKGDLIMRLEAEGKEAAVESARQALAQREAEAAAAERLAESGNMARLQLDAARSALASARSALEVAEADLDRTKVFAPFPGVVDRIDVEEGSGLQQGAEIATLLKLDPILAVGEVSERDLGLVRKGGEAEVRLVSGETFRGTIRHISRAASPQTRTFRIEVAIPNPDGTVPAGMTAEIAVEGKMVETVALPRSVVTLNQDGELGVRGVDRSGKVDFFPIDIVDDTPQALYLAGIPADTRVIVAGQDLVTDGETVNVQMADENDLAGSVLGKATQ